MNTSPSSSATGDQSIQSGSAAPGLPPSQGAAPIVRLRPIGVIRSPHRDPNQTPIQPPFAPGIIGRIELDPEFAAGLDDLTGFSHIYLIYHLDRAGPAKLHVKPFLQDVERGIFATRAPNRPNPIGLSLVRLLGRDGAVLEVEGIDVLDGTPLLDIKPYARRYDAVENPRGGWTEEIDEETAWRRGSRGQPRPSK